MFGSSVLDVAIGLVFLYLLLSLLCTSINEFIESLLKNRSKDLERGLRELLGDPQGTGLVQKLYQHPLISSLFRNDYKPGGANLPSYLPSRQFALALLDIVRPANAMGLGTPPPPAATEPGPNQTQPRPRHQVSGAAFMTTPGASQPIASPAADAGDTGATPAPPTPGVSTADIIPDLRHAVANNGQLGDGVKRAVLTLIDAAGNDVNQVLQNLEGWYDGAMNRVSEWYRQRTRWISLAVGFVLTVVINADTFAVAKSLSRDQALRTTITSSAQLYAESHARAPASGVDQEGGSQPTSPKGIKELVNEFNDVHEVGWPLGWDRDDRRKVPRWSQFSPPQWDRFVAEWVLKFFGWVVTAIAISLGAPFWFDILNRISPLRPSAKSSQQNSPEKPANT
jgi:hypothetical protein